MEQSRGESSGCSGNEDRISNLPDNLIHQILSFIDMKYVVQTCVLSSRWRYVWTSLPVLHFQDLLHLGEDEDDEEPYEKKFVNFVHKVLSLRENSDICTFYLQVLGPHNGEIAVDDFYKWIAIAVHHNVQELSIDICIYGDFEIPACLCTCKSLTELKLELLNNQGCHCEVMLPSSMSLPRLKSLNLCFSHLSFNDEKLACKFFSSFPTIESLVVRHCGLNGMKLDMSFPNLKYFEWDDIKGDGGIHENSNAIKLYAPSLTSFILKVYMPTFTLENLSSLVNADMRIWMHTEKKDWFPLHMMRFFRGFYHVKILNLDGPFLEALGGFPDILDSQQLELYRLKILKLSVDLSGDSLRTIFYMLKISPRIESVYLSLLRKDPSDTVYPFRGEVKWNSEDIGGLALPRMIYHLKFVEIKHMKGRLNELKLLATLLKHAMVLEKVVLCSTTSRKQLKEKKKQMKKFCDLLLTLPRASTNVTISYSLSDLHTYLQNQKLAN